MIERWLDAYYEWTMTFPDAIGFALNMALVLGWFVFWFTVIILVNAAWLLLQHF